MFELEADATIPAEYVLLRHYLGEPVDAALEAKIAVYLRRIQGAHGGWPLFHDGDLDMSASVKAYFALKMIGDSIRRAAHAARPRGDSRARRRRRSQCLHPFVLALYGILPWRSGAGDAGGDHAAAELVPVPSRQGVVLGRTVLVPLLVMMAIKRGAQSRGRRGSTNCFSSRRRRRAGAEGAAPESSGSGSFRGIDDVLRAAEPVIPKRSRRRAIDKAVAWVPSV